MASTPDAVRPQLFGQLGPDIFTVFSGGNRALYERAILAVYDELYRSDLLFPTQAEVVRVIYERLSREPSLWTEDEAAIDLDRLVTRTGKRVRRRRVEGAHDEVTGTVISRSRHIYNRLLQTGWLDESSYGLKTTVEMPSGPMRLAEFLCSLKEGASEQLGGLVVEVRNAIRAVREKPAENALGLNKAAKDATSFGRYLRSVLSSLRDVDRLVTSAMTIIFGRDGAAQDLEPEEHLGSFGISRLPQPMLMRGPVTIGGQPLPAMPYVGIPVESAATVELAGTPDYVITIENYASFVRYVREVAVGDGGLVVFSGGFPSRSALDAIVRLAGAAGRPTFHWGDMDAGGVRIFHHIERRLAAIGVELRPHMMDPDLFRRLGVPVPDASRATGDTSTSVVAGLAQLIRESGLVHEQEELAPRRPSVAPDA